MDAVTWMCVEMDTVRFPFAVAGSGVDVRRLHANGSGTLDAHTTVVTSIMTDRNANRGGKVEVTINMPSLLREFPRDVEMLLPLRNAMRHYKMNRGRVTTSSETPESDGEGISKGRMFGMAVYPPVVGHGLMVNGELCVCEWEYMDVSQDVMADAVVRSSLGSLKWVLGDDPGAVYPTSRVSDMMLYTASFYSEGGPMCAYNNQAVTEAMNHSSDSGFWQSLYPPLEDLECNYGFIGVCHDNTVISLGTAAGDDSEPNLVERMPKPDQDGFLDSCYTPSSKSSGKVRTLAVGVSVRIKTRRTIEIASSILAVLKRPNGIAPKNWVVRCIGYCSTYSEKDVRAIVDEWKKYSEVNMPTIHVFRRSQGFSFINISVATGVLVRPVRWKVVRMSSDLYDYDIKYEGPIVDTVSVHKSDTITFANMRFPQRESEPE
ncbi:hypothetical protein AYL99_11822 [Fonsecaea erecta]|uniref:Uncharacterized protein n=1 Tax=Fonsecaea erecta TaxID=1367422 RepID=A0A178Z2D6_9EURO|nr:hypothetical protein AYL99_11822 [Fonsecaea erecta]OAP53942.1 hypothetical protein AYL99_11822 [Fonsecaea erecta]